MYTDTELKDMALTVLDDEVSGGGRAIVLYMTMGLLTGLDPADVRARIIRMTQ